MIVDVDDTGVTVKFQSQTFKGARFCVRKEGGEGGVEEAELDLLQARFRQIGTDVGCRLRQVDVGKKMVVDRDDGTPTPSTGNPESGSGPRPETIPAPESLSLSAPLPSPRGNSERRQYLEPSFNNKCALSQAPRANGAQNDELTLGQAHDQRSQRGCRKKESMAVLKTRLSAMDTAEDKRNAKVVTQEDGRRERASVRGVKVPNNPTQPTYLVRKRGRAPEKGAKDSDNLTHLLHSTRGGGNKATLGSGKGEREQAPAQEAKDSVDPSTFLGENAMDTSATLAGKRERAPKEGVMDSDIPSQSIDKKSRLADPHLASVMDKGVVKGNARRRQPAMEGKIDTQTRIDPRAPLMVGRGDVGFGRVGFRRAQSYFAVGIDGR